MRINTKYLGEIEITEDQILSFPEGLLGFEDHSEFVLLDIQDNDHFKFLQDIHNSYISFLLINPWDFFKDYDIIIPSVDLEKMGIYSPEEMKLYNIVTLGSKFQESTANLLAPIVINPRDKVGRQFILNDGEYTTTHKLFNNGEEIC